MNDPKQDVPKASWNERRDFVGLIGLALLGYGAWLVFPPAGFIVPGAVMSGVAVFGVRE